VKIRIEGASKSFSEKTALSGIELVFEPGSFTVLLGPNGAGKTTLLRVVDLILRPDSGEVYYDNRPARALKRAEVVAIRRRMAFVEQNPIVFSGSVEWNAAYGLRARGVREYAGKIHETLKFVGLTHLAKAPAQCLSGGETQRLTLARALIVEPEVLLLDEPGSNIDAQSISMVSSFIGKAVSSGTSVILVTHFPEEYLPLNPAVVVMRDGQIVRKESLATLLRDPEDTGGTASRD